jgi:hypothetical protein
MKTFYVYEIEAEIDFPLNSKRKFYIGSGYRPGFSLLPNDFKKQFSGRINLIGRNELEKGQKSLAEIRFVTREFYEQFKTGAEYSFWEGQNFIGTARVISIKPIRTEIHSPPSN